MHVHDGFPAIQLFEHRLEFCVAEPFIAIARAKAHTVGVKDIERVGDLGKRAVNVVHGQRCEQAKAIRIVTAESRTPLISIAGFFSCELCGFVSAIGPAYPIAVVTPLRSSSSAARSIAHGVPSTLRPLLSK